MSIRRVGSEFQVNVATVGHQMNSHVAVLADGRFVVAFEDQGLGSGRIRFRIFNADGSPSSAEISPTSGMLFGQYSPSIATLSDGRFVITYADRHAIGGGVIDGDIRAIIFNADGTPSVASFGVNADTARDQFDSRVTALSGGRFLVTYSDDVTVGGASDQGIIRGRIFNANGAPATADFQISTASHGQTKDSQITALADGRFVVTYSDFNQVPASYIGWDVRARVYNADGTPSGAEFVANANPLYYQQEGDVAALPDGRFVVSYSSSPNGIYARIFNANGTESVAAFQVNTTTGNHRDSNIAVLADGRIAMTFVQWGNAAHELRVRIFNTDGTEAIPEQVIATSTFFILDSTLTAKPDGTLLVTYTDYTGGPEGTTSASVRAQIFDPRIFDGTAANDTVTGGALNDYLYGGAGNDVFFGRAGNDLLHGGVGADYLDGGDGFDWASYAFATASVDARLYDASLNTGDAAFDAFVSIEALQGSAFNDVLIGNGAGNVLMGGAGDDYIDGLGGGDYLYGEAGGDQFNLRAGADYVDGGDGFDFVRFDYATSGVRVSLVGSASNTGWAAGDTYVSIEGIAGSAYADRLQGSGVANIIYGGSGNDVIDGYGAPSGIDYLYAGDGNDTIYGRRSADYIDGGAGLDQVNYLYATAAVTVHLGVPSSQTAWAAGDNLVGIENLGGTRFGDDLRGDASRNSIFGNAGNDFIVGHGGADRLSGGAGADMFYYASPTEGRDTITDFTSGQDRIAIYGPSFGLGNLGGAAIPASRFVLGTAATTAQSQFIYDVAAHTLWYDQDGTGVAGKIAIATLQAGAVMTHADLIVY